MRALPLHMLVCFAFTSGQGLTRARCHASASSLYLHVCTVQHECSNRQPWHSRSSGSPHHHPMPSDNSSCMHRLLPMMRAPVHPSRSTFPALRSPAEPQHCAPNFPGNSQRLVCHTICCLFVHCSAGYMLLWTLQQKGGWGCSSRGVAAKIQGWKAQRLPAGRGWQRRQCRSRSVHQTGAQIEYGSNNTVWQAQDGQDVLSLTPGRSTTDMLGWLPVPPSPALCHSPVPFRPRTIPTPMTWPSYIGAKEIRGASILDITCHPQRRPAAPWPSPPLAIRIPHPRTRPPPCHPCSQHQGPARPRR